MDEKKWKEAMRISNWYVSKKLRKLACVVGGQDIVSETMLALLATSDEAWASASFSTIVCNKTRWSAYKLYYQHKKLSKSDKEASAQTDSYRVDFDANILSDDIKKAIRKAKDKVVGDIRKSIGKPPRQLIAAGAWRYENRDALRRIERYESSIIETKITNDMTLEDIGRELGVTRERARQIELKFWAQIRLAMSQIYEMPIDKVGSLLLHGEC